MRSTAGLHRRSEGGRGGNCYRPRGRTGLTLPRGTMASQTISPPSWRFPAEVPGWLTEPEGRKLAELSRGKRVLELGTYLGRSAICIAQTAVNLLTIDWHQGDDGT